MTKYAPANAEGEKPYVVEVWNWGREQLRLTYASNPGDARRKVLGRPATGIYAKSTRRATPEDVQAFAEEGGRMNIPTEVYDKALPHRFAQSDEVHAFHVVAEWARREALEEAAALVKADIERLELIRGTYSKAQRHTLGIVWAALVEKTHDS